MRKICYFAKKSQPLHSYHLNKLSILSILYIESNSVIPLMSDDNDGVYRTNIYLIFNPRVVVRHLGLLDWVSDFLLIWKAK